MIGTIHSLSLDIEPLVIQYRRDFHRHAELGWGEYRTASIIARKLDEFGFAVRVGPEILDEKSRMGLPGEEVRETQFKRALTQGAVAEYAKNMVGGYTGVVATLQNGEGPTIGYRFDLDALEVRESDDSDHRPWQEGFASILINGVKILALTAFI